MDQKRFDVFYYNNPKILSLKEDFNNVICKMFTNIK